MPVLSVNFEEDRAETRLDSLPTVFPSVGDEEMDCSGGAQSDPKVLGRSSLWMAFVLSITDLLIMGKKRANSGLHGSES